MQTNTPEQMRAAKNYTDALMALSQVAFSGAERLTALNLNTARAVLEDGFAAKSLLQTKDVSDPANLPIALNGPAMEKWAAYFRGLLQIATDSQQEAGQVLTQYFTSLGFEAANTGANAGFDMFSKLMKDTNSAFEANAKAFGDATTNMMAPVTRQPKKVA
jgi:phasin family protein